jgi:hypothetical protein
LELSVKLFGDGSVREAVYSRLETRKSLKEVGASLLEACLYLGKLTNIRNFYAIFDKHDDQHLHVT